MISCRPSQGVCWEGNIPFTWENLPGNYPAPETVLTQLQALDSTTSQTNENSDLHAQAWWRIEQKLNILLGLLPNIPAINAHLPAQHFVHFDAHGLDWLSASDIPTNKSGLAVLHLAGSLPLPLALPAQVIGYEKHADHYLVSIQWAGWSEELQSAFDKFLFRHHRQQIRQQRQQN